MNTSTSQIKPIIFWEGFPPCGLLMKKVADEFGDDIVIVATRAAVPFEGLEEMFGHKIVWLDTPNDIWKRREEFPDRNFVVHTGWAHTGWLKYDMFVKKKNNAKIVVSVDNSFRGDFRQKIGSLYYKMYLSKIFDAALVPGKSGVQLMKYFGVPENRIYTGLYGAFEEIYVNTELITERPKEFLYVGQLEERKGIDVLLDAFRLYRENGGTWNLRIAGSGSLQDKCSGDGIVYAGFAQPNSVADLMNASRVFILPSRHDNWGTVVCEAAACGMMLITTKEVGASADIVKSPENGVELAELTKEKLANAMRHFEDLPGGYLTTGSELSMKIASSYDSQNYYDSFKKMLSDLTNQTK